MAGTAEKIARTSVYNYISTIPESIEPDEHTMVSMTGRVRWSGLEKQALCRCLLHLLHKAHDDSYIFVQLEYGR